jgi:GAF domain-containing protein
MQRPKMKQPQDTAPKLQTLDDIRQKANDVLRFLLAGASSQETLARLTRVAEDLAGDRSVSSILVIKEDGLLHNGCSPQLPADYIAAIDGLKPDPKVGTCAAAAATGQIVVTPDFTADDKWAELRHLPRQLGFIGAWSMPIKDENGRVIGTFGTYYRNRRSPSNSEVEGLKLLSAVAARAIKG